LVTEDPIKLGL